MVEQCGQNSAAQEKDRTRRGEKVDLRGSALKEARKALEESAAKCCKMTDMLRDTGHG